MTVFLNGVGIDITADTMTYDLLTMGGYTPPNKHYLVYGGDKIYGDKHLGDCGVCSESQVQVEYLPNLSIPVLLVLNCSCPNINKTLSFVQTVDTTVRDIKNSAEMLDIVQIRVPQKIKVISDGAVVPDSMFTRELGSVIRCIIRPYC